MRLVKGNSVEFKTKFASYFCFFKMAASIKKQSSNFQEHISLHFQVKNFPCAYIITFHSLNSCEIS